MCLHNIKWQSSRGHRLQIWPMPRQICSPTQAFATIISCPVCKEGQNKINVFPITGQSVAGGQIIARDRGETRCLEYLQGRPTPKHCTGQLEPEIKYICKIPGKDAHGHPANCQIWSLLDCVLCSQAHAKLASGQLKRVACHAVLCSDKYFLRRFCLAQTATCTRTFIMNFIPTKPQHRLTSPHPPSPLPNTYTHARTRAQKHERAVSGSKATHNCLRV